MNQYQACLYLFECISLGDFKCGHEIPKCCATKKYCTFVCFSARSDLLIQPISVCHISNERKQISDQISVLLFLRGRLCLCSYDRIHLLLSYFLCTLYYVLSVYCEYISVYRVVPRIGLIYLALRNQRILEK